MSLRTYGLQFACDACQATAPGPAVLPGDRPIPWDDTPVPDGWTAIQPMLSITVKDAYGSMVSHLCPACSALPIGELAAKLKESARHTQVALLWAPC